jgi:hypothetical protein
MELPAGVSTSTYTYAGTGYANPHAVTSIGNPFSTLSTVIYSEKEKRGLITLNAISLAFTTADRRHDVALAIDHRYGAALDAEMEHQTIRHTTEGAPKPRPARCDNG